MCDTCAGDRLDQERKDLGLDWRTEALEHSNTRGFTAHLAQSPEKGVGGVGGMVAFEPKRKTVERYNARRSAAQRDGTEPHP